MAQSRARWVNQYYMNGQYNSKRNTTQAQSGSFSAEDPESRFKVANLWAAFRNSDEQKGQECHDDRDIFTEFCSVKCLGGCGLLAAECCTVSHPVHQRNGTDLVAHHPDTRSYGASDRKFHPNSGPWQLSLIGGGGRHIIWEGIQMATYIELLEALDTWWECTGLVADKHGLDQDRRHVQVLHECTCTRVSSNEPWRHCD
ncbi:putative P3 [Johnsongrass umbra-like virus 1]|nr:putative P3 [Johnsongrass umbra-like virus 1]